jgi:ABC-type multidrug transport system fused ATPase/permease subunit
VCFAVDRKLQSSIPTSSVKLLRRFEINSGYNEILCQNLQLNKWTIKIYVWLSVVVYGISTMFMTMQFLVIGKMELQFLIYMPFTNCEELSGYLINLIFIGGLAVLAFVGFMTYDLLLITYAFQIKANVDILREKLLEFESYLQDKTQSVTNVSTHIRRQLEIGTQKAEEETRNDDEAKRKLIDFIKDYEQHLQYVKDIDRMQAPLTFVAMGAIGVSLCIGLFIITKVSILGGITAFGIYFFQMILPCAVGSMISIQVK